MGVAAPTVGDQTIHAIGHIANHKDTLNKTVKVTIPAVEIVINILGLIPGADVVKAGFGVLKGTLGSAKSFMNATNIVSRGADWADSKKRADIVEKGWVKVASRVALTVAQVLETIGFVDKLSLGFFSQAALCLAGTQIFVGVKNLFYLGSAVLGIYDYSKDLIKANAGINAAAKNKRKWTQIESGNLKFDLKSHYQQKLQLTQAFVDDKAMLNGELDTLRNKLTGASVEDAKTITADITKKEDQIKAFEKKAVDDKISAVKVERFEKFLEAIEDGKSDSLIKYKIDKYNTRLANNKELHTKSWISLVVDIGKIVMITLGMLVMALTAVFNPAATVAVGFAMSGLSLVSNSFGLTKNLYTKLAPKEVQEPEFAPVAA